MFELLNSETSRWVVGVIVTILIGMASVFAPRFLNRKRKTLWYRERSYPLVRRGVEDERIEILFDGEPVPDVYMSTIGLWYQGTDPIVEDDYRTPVTFDYGEARVLDAEIVSSSPEGLTAGLSVENARRVIFSPVAMNDGNVVTARALLTSRRRSPKVAGHIVDVKEIKDHREYRSFPDYLFRIAIAMTGAGAALMLIFVLIFAVLLSPASPENAPLPSIVWGAIGLMAGGTILLFPAVFLTFRSIDKSPL